MMDKMMARHAEAYGDEHDEDCPLCGVDAQVPVHTTMSRFFYPTERCREATDDTGWCVAHMAVHTMHTVGGRTSNEGWPYGTTHDMDCPGCKDVPFLLSPRSETYWSS